MIRHANGWMSAGTLLLALACVAASAQEKSAWPVEQQRGGSDAGSSAAAPAMGGMQHGQMGGMNAGEASQGGMQHGAMGGMSQGSGGMGGMQHGGGGGGGMMGGGMMGGMPAMSDQEKEDLLKKALELDLKLGQLRIRIAQASDEAERERLKAEHRAVFQEYLPKLHKLMMQSHMESMKMQGGSSGQPMKH